jgi:hypothetical protein
MPIWTVAPVSEEPSVFLSQWRILETEEKSIHFVGHDMSDSMGRVSSAVCRFDPVTLRSTTRSGRIYQLVGQQGRAKRAQYVWSRWCELNEVSSYADVTSQMLVGAPK